MPSGRLWATRQAWRTQTLSERARSAERDFLCVVDTLPMEGLRKERQVSTSRRQRQSGSAAGARLAHLDALADALVNAFEDDGALLELDREAEVGIGVRVDGVNMLS